MSNIAPILWIKGRVRRVEPRDVDPLPAREAQYDPETGALTAEARDAMPGYSVHDVTVDTEPGGFVTVVLREDVAAVADGLVPSVGDTVDLPVRAYTKWNGRGQRRWASNGYSVAGALYAASCVTPKKSEGARSLAPAV